jgi:hypothetical protein
MSEIDNDNPRLESIKTDVWEALTQAKQVYSFVMGVEQRKCARELVRLLERADANLNRKNGGSV